MLIGILCGLPSGVFAAEAGERPTVVIVVGASGSDEYGKLFAAWAERWESAARRGEARVVRIGTEEASKGDEDANVSDRDRLRERLATLSREAQRRTAQPRTTRPRCGWHLSVTARSMDGRRNSIYVDLTLRRRIWPSGARQSNVRSRSSTARRPADRF